jgi:hypothetical protein
MRVKRLVILLSFIVLAVASGLFIFWAMGTSWFWGFQISAYEKQDRINPPKPGVVVFTGSSSIRFWRTRNAQRNYLAVLILLRLCGIFLVVNGMYSLLHVVDRR